ncbi:MAG: transcription elongation factor GreA [Anaerolineales bacterium]|nr:transcription elongation factor GreA [Anaerolineales bacterium]
MHEEAFYITDEGLQKIKEELEFLRTTKREELAKKLEVAIAQGDLKENADYHAAKEEQGFTEGRIRDLEDALRRAVVIKETGPSDRVRVGSTVTVVDEEYGDAETYSIVGPHEANPSEGRISNQSPIGRALIGAKIGQIVVASSPAGEIRLQVQSIA